MGVDMTAKTESFPSVLHRMLTEIDHLKKRNEDTSKLHQIISWQGHGMAFKIHNRQKFKDIVMPIWFSRLKYCSLVRQLNSFGFKRVQTEGDDKGALYHELFVRDRPDQVTLIGKPKRNKNATGVPTDTGMHSFPRVVSSGNTCAVSAPLPDQSQSQETQVWASSPYGFSPTVGPMKPMAPAFIGRRSDTLASMTAMMVHRNHLPVGTSQPCYQGSMSCSWWAPPTQPEHQGSLHVDSAATWQTLDGDSLEPLNIFDGQCNYVLNDEDNGVCLPYSVGSSRTEELEDIEPLHVFQGESEPEQEIMGQFAFHTIVDQY